MDETIKKKNLSRYIKVGRPFFQKLKEYYRNFPSILEDDAVEN